MIVRIIKPSEEAWWNNFIGETFKVKPSAEYPTHYHLLDRVPGEPFAFLISKEDCVIVNSNDTSITNKSVSSILTREE